MIDITRALHPDHPVWPGDDPFRLEPAAVLGEDGSPVNALRLETSTHIGSHLDAPWHYDAGGARLGGVPLERTVGEAQVLHLLAEGALGAELLEPVGELPERVLIRTGQPDRWREFPRDFRGLTPELIHALADRGVRLVGVDAPSVDALDSEGLPVHRACAERDVLIVEGLALAEVPEGRYRLVCLPLRIPHADASPVRALLEPLA